MKTMSLWRLYVHNKIFSKNVYILKQQTQTLLTSPLNVANEQFTLLRWTIPFFEYLSFKWANSGRGFTPTKTLSFSEIIWYASALEAMVVPLLPFFPFSNFLWLHRLKITHCFSSHNFFIHSFFKHKTQIDIGIRWRITNWYLKTPVHSKLIYTYLCKTSW